MKPAALLLTATLLLAGCVATADPDPETAYRRACAEASRGDLASALESLEASLEAGLTRPSRALIDPALAPLNADPGVRPAVRELLGRHARDSEITLVAQWNRPGEPGEAIVVEGRVVDAATGAAIPSVWLELVQTDAAGRYTLEEGAPVWNPHLFGYLRTRTDGGFRVKTIRPGRYKSSPGDEWQPLHIHFAASAGGYVDLGSEILFADDPLLSEITEGAHVEGFVARVQSGDPAPVARVEIRLDPVAARGR